MFDTTTFDGLQEWVGSKMKKHHDAGQAKTCAALGLAGEAGEYADLVKKELYHNKPADKQVKARELGDALFYIAACAAEEGIKLSEVVAALRAKLDDRYPFGFEEHRSHSHVEK